MIPGIVRSLRRRQREDERLVPYDSISRLILSVLIFPSLAFSDFLSPPCFLMVASLNINSASSSS
jgi:hypothetical protein